MSRWHVIESTAVSKKRYSRAEVAALIEKAARAHGVDPATIGPTVARLLPGKPQPVAKSAAQIEQERSERQRAIEADMELRRDERLRKTERQRLDLERSMTRSADVARAAVNFDDAQATLDADAPVTRLDLSNRVEKRATCGLFGEIVEAPPTEPYTYRSGATR